MSDAIVTLTKHDLKVFEFAGTDDMRPMLSHILVRPTKDGGVELVATDSYAAVIHQVNGKVEGRTFEPFLIHAGIFKMLYKLCGTRTLPATRRPGRANLKARKIIDQPVLYPKHAEIDTLGIKVDYDTLEEVAKYPDIEKAIKNAGQGAQAYSVKLQRGLIEKATKFVGSHWLAHGSVEIKVNGQYEPVIVRSDHTTAYVMPLRG